jgi:hypothetical protein
VYSFADKTIAKILNIRASTEQPHKWRDGAVRGAHPETREGASLTTLYVPITPSYVEERVYLFGGLSRDLYSSLYYLRLDRANGT